MLFDAEPINQEDIDAAERYGPDGKLKDGTDRKHPFYWEDIPTVFLLLVLGQLGLSLLFEVLGRMMGGR